MTARAGANSSSRFQRPFTRMAAISPMPNRKLQANCETAEAGWDGGIANHNTPRMTASIKAQIPMAFQFSVASDNGGGTNLPGCWARNDSTRRTTYSIASVRARVRHRFAVALDGGNPIVIL